MNSTFPKAIVTVIETEVRVFSDTVLCVGNNHTFPNQTRATKHSVMWDSSTFSRTNDIKCRQVVQFIGTFFQGDPNQERVSEAKPYSCLCSTTLNIRNK